MPALPPPIPPSAGGWHSIFYTLKSARRTGGVLRMLRALRARNACKTCALGMGGQQGGMTNERGRFPEVCKKSVQAMAADMQGRIKPGFFDEFPLDKLARFSPRELEHAGRLCEPLYAGPADRSYRPISWDDALARVAAAMRTAKTQHGPDSTFFYFSGRSSNEAAFLLQIVARLFGTNNVNNCSYFCHQASGVAMASVLGSGTATITLDDLDHCDFVMLLGGNPASNHPRLMRTLMEVRRRRGRVVVVNPIRERGLVNFKVPSDLRSMLVGSPIADLYIQPHIGGDIAFMYAVAKALIESAAIDSGFIDAHSEGFADFAAAVHAASWDELVEQSGVAEPDIRAVAATYAKATSAVFCWTMGMTHHQHGVNNVRMIANLALLRGMLGRPGAGLLPLRGHSNVQGVGSMGATPALKDQVLRAIEARFGVSLPTSPGLDTLACVHKADRGEVAFALHLGGNLFGSCPDAAFARRALSRIGMTVFLSTTLNTGHVLGRGKESIVLPVRARDEEAQPTTQESMFNFVRLSDGGPARYPGPRGEVNVIATLAQAALADSPAARAIDFGALLRHENLRDAIADVIPGYDPIRSIDSTKKEFHVEGRTFREPRFATATGRARFFAPPIPPAPPRDNGFLTLMTIRSEGQFNTVVYEEEDVYRGTERRDVIFLSAQDMRRLKLSVNDAVTVRSDTGEMSGILVRQIDIRPGSAAMYYPEANVLVPALADPESKTPAFKSVPITISKTRSLI
ncbi:MAG: FdhF/YdeP family oxidoreductase [Phycisphaerales bacterium]